MSRAFTIVLLLMALAFGSGCTTEKLWTGTAHWDANYLPAVPNDLELFQARDGRDILVIYNEASERRDSVRRRAYYLQTNESVIQHRRRPHFVKVSLKNGLEPIPVFDSADRLHTGTAVYAVASPDDSVFRIYGADGNEGVHMLPIYSDGVGRAKRIALMPLALTADATLLCGWGILQGWASSGSSDTPYP